MKIIEEGKVDPNFLMSLDRRTNIVFCTTPYEKDTITELEYIPDTFSIHLARDINTSSEDVTRVSSNIIATTVRPTIKICFPVGLKIQFSDFMEDFKQNIFLKIYRSFNHKTVFDPETEDMSHILISDLVFDMYIDVARMREVKFPMMIRKGTRLSDFYFIWYAQTKKDMLPINEIYLISDEYIYQDFFNIF